MNIRNRLHGIRVDVWMEVVESECQDGGSSVVCPCLPNHICYLQHIHCEGKDCGRLYEGMHNPVENQTQALSSRDAQ